MVLARQSSDPIDTDQSGDERIEVSEDEPLISADTELPLSSKSKQPLVLIEFTAFLYFISLVTPVPVVQFYLLDYFSAEYGISNHNITEYTCDSTNFTHSNESSWADRVQESANSFNMYITLILNISAVIPTLLFGLLSDRYGRKLVLYISNIGLFLAHLLLLSIFYWKWPPQVLFASYFLQGLSGSFGLFLAAVFGVVADISSPGKQRTFRVTSVEATIAIGISVASITSGIWITKLSYFWPLVFCAGLDAINIIFVLFFIPETLQHNHSTEIQNHAEKFSWKMFVRSFKFYFQDTVDKRRFKLVVCIICFLVSLGSVIGEANIFLLYLFHAPFCWSKVFITSFNGVSTLTKWISILCFTQLTKRWISEPIFAIIGILSCCVTYLCRGLAQDNTLIYVGTGVGILMDMVSPMLRTMMSKAVPASEQGSLFAGIGVLQMLVSTFSGILISIIYNEGLKTFFGLPYIVLAGGNFFSLLLFMILYLRIRRHPELEPSIEASINVS